MRLKKLVVFPHGSWEQYPYRELLAVLSEHVEIQFVVSGPLPPLPVPPPGIRFLPRAELASLEGEEHAAIISHPYWLLAASRLRPARLIAMIAADSPDGHNPLWRKYASQLTAAADLVCAEAEAEFLQISFRHRAVLLLRDPERIPEGSDTAETLVVGALRELLAGGAAESYTVRAWRGRAAYYRKLREQLGPHETASFLLAVYQYLLDEPEAEANLLEAFEMTLVRQQAGGLQSHYRFLSAIYAAQDRLEEGIRVYGITAQNEEDRGRYEKLCLWYESGQAIQAKDHLLRYNDDFRPAIGAWERWQTEASASATDTDIGIGRTGRTTAPYLVQWLLECGYVEAAYHLVQAEPHLSSRDKLTSLVLTGSVKALRGDRHGAIHAFLRAAAIGEEALAHVLELSALDEALDQLMDGSPDGTLREKAGTE